MPKIAIPKAVSRAHASAKTVLKEHPWLVVGGITALGVLAYFVFRSPSEPAPQMLPRPYVGPGGTGPSGTASTTVPALPSAMNMPATVTPAAPYTYSTIFDTDVQASVPWYATVINPLAAALSNATTPSGHWKVVDSLGLTMWITGYRGKNTPPPDAVVRAQLMAHYSALGTSNPYVVAQLQTQQGSTARVSYYAPSYSPYDWMM